MTPTAYPAGAEAPAATVTGEHPAACVDQAPAAPPESHGLVPGELASLARRLFPRGNAAGGLRSVLFAGVGDDGASAGVCAGTAEALAAETSGSVCLVDGKLRVPSIHTAYGLSRALGLSDLLFQGAELSACLIRLRANLSLLPAGSPSIGAPPILTAKRARLVIAALLDRFDYVLIDATAASAHGDVAVMGPLVDGSVLVIKADRTRRDLARKIAVDLQSANARIVGAVLTNRAYPIPEALYRRL